MKLRFEVDQSAAFRAGIDCPKSVIEMEVDPSQLPQEERDMIADLLHGIDVCREVEANGLRRRIIATAPTYEALLKAIREHKIGGGPATRLLDRSAAEERRPA